MKKVQCAYLLGYHERIQNKKICNDLIEAQITYIEYAMLKEEKVLLSLKDFPGVWFGYDQGDIILAEMDKREWFLEDVPDFIEKIDFGLYCDRLEEICRERGII